MAEQEDCKDGVCPSNGNGEDDEIFLCMQSETTKEIQNAQAEHKKLIQKVEGSQSLLSETQDSIKATLEVMNGSLGRIFRLYEKQEERLDKGDKLFQEIHEFMSVKKQANGYTEDGLKEVKDDIKGLKADVGNININLAKVMLKLEDKKEKRKLKVKRNDAILIGVILAVITQAILFVVFMVKTFIWHY